jgi:hypothetical protein
MQSTAQGAVNNAYSLLPNYVKVEFQLNLHSSVNDSQQF